MIKTYKKTATIDAMEWVGTWAGTEHVTAWTQSFGVEVELVKFDDGWKLRIPTLEGPMFASVGDFIAKGIKPDIMEKTYQEVS